MCFKDYNKHKNKKLIINAIVIAKKDDVLGKESGIVKLVGWGEASFD